MGSPDGYAQHGKVPKLLYNPGLPFQRHSKEPKPMSYRHITIPEAGQKLSIVDNRLVVPDNPILGFVEGDGIGPETFV